MNKEDKTLTYRIDIGFPLPSRTKSEKLYERMVHLKKQRKDAKIEKLVRSQQCMIYFYKLNFMNLLQITYN